jgi:hypothetical protein
LVNGRLVSSQKKPIHSSGMASQQFPAVVVVVVVVLVVVVGADVVVSRVHADHVTWHSSSGGVGGSSQAHSPQRFSSRTHVSPLADHLQCPPSQLLGGVVLVEVEVVDPLSQAAAQPPSPSPSGVVVVPDWSEQFEMTVAPQAHPPVGATHLQPGEVIALQSPLKKNHSPTSGSPVRLVQINSHRPPHGTGDGGGS